MGMKTAKKKTAKAVKKGSPSKTRGPAAGGAPLRLEVGKTYITRDGRWKAKIIAHDGSLHWPYIGKWLGRNKPTEAKLGCATSAMWNDDGSIYYRGTERPTDLVREVPRPPRAK